LEKVIYFAGYIVTGYTKMKRRNCQKNLESEFKAKIKSVTDEEEKLKLKNCLQIQSAKSTISFQEKF
jgi:hypothetical protein